MLLPPRQFDDLPEAVRRAVETEIGPVTTSRPAGGATESGVAALLVTAAGTVYVKGVPADDEQALFVQGREAIARPYLPECAPRMLSYIKAGGWSVAIYEAVEGEHLDYGESRDLALLLDALTELEGITLPAGSGLSMAAVRWAGYADEGCSHLFGGSTLLHTDLSPDNVLVGERAYLVNWTWPTVGAAFIDPYLLVLEMVHAGHQPADAITWARRMRSWREASPDALEAFAVATMRVWREKAVQDPQHVSRASSAAVLRTVLLTLPWARNA